MRADEPDLVTRLTGIPLRILLIIVVSAAAVIVLRWLSGRLMTRLGQIPARKKGRGRRAGKDGRRPADLPGEDRVGQRLRTFQSVLNSTITCVIGIIALVMVLDQLGINVGPIVASAGIAGVALAFGAQSLVSDIVSGLFMLVEDQYGVGDRVELAGGATLATGTVEKMALRVTSIRDDNGSLWHVRNGEILRVANASQGWAKAEAQVRLSAGTDIAAAREALTECTRQLARDPAFEGSVLSEPEIRVEDVSATDILVSWSVQTPAGQQWRVASGLRRLVPGALAEHGISLAGG